MVTTRQTDNMPPPLPRQQGRDEMNLAEFPISVATKVQPREKDGRKLDQVVYESSTYNPVTRRRVPQRVTLTTSSRYGLPTPADENVVLALLFTAKKTNDFRDPRVHFVPLQLFRIMGWAPNSRSYNRLEDVLDRLQTVQIKYENAWWDAGGREFEEVFATGIIADYRIRKPKHRKGNDPASGSYVHWRPEFFNSLARDNIKKLDLELYFSLRLPTAQRMYRFLDKRFYNSSTVELDLKDFACGHMGLADPGDNGQLKYRLNSAIAELERIGFLAPAGPQGRYKKIKKGIWRVCFEPEAKRLSTDTPQPPQDARPAAPQQMLPVGTPASELVAAFYAAWSPDTPPSEQAEPQARGLIEKYGHEQVQGWLPKVIKRMQADFPDAHHFGASLPFFANIAQEHADRQEHQRQLQQEAAQRRAELERTKQQHTAEQAFIAQWQPVWEGLTDEQRGSILTAVLAANPVFNTSPKLRQSHFVTRLCLQELATHSEASKSNVADSPQTV